MTPGNLSKLYVAVGLIDEVCCDHYSGHDNPQEKSAFDELRKSRERLALVSFTFHHPKAAEINNTMQLKQKGNNE